MKDFLKLALIFISLSIGCGTIIFGVCKIETHYKENNNKPSVFSLLNEDQSIRGTITVIHDDIRHVTCWIYASGVSCIPDKNL